MLGVVVCTVPAAFEFEDFFAVGKCTGQPEGREGAFCARGTEADAFSAGRGFYDAFGQVDDRFVEGVEGGAEGGLFLYGGYDAWMGVTEDEGTGAHDVVNVFAAVHVVEAATFSMMEYGGYIAGHLETAQAAAYEITVGTFE